MMRVSIFIVFFAITGGCQKMSHEERNLAMRDHFLVSNKETGLKCDQTIIQDTIIKPGVCEVVILKDTNIVKHVLASISNRQWLALLSFKSTAKSASIWLHMKFGKDGTHFYKLSSSEWFERYWKREVKYWSEYFMDQTI
jgi:hypothetical protein